MIIQFGTFHEDGRTRKILCEIWTNLWYIDSC